MASPGGQMPLLNISTFPMHNCEIDCWWVAINVTNMWHCFQTIPITEYYSAKEKDDPLKFMGDNRIHFRLQFGGKCIKKKRNQTVYHDTSDLAAEEIPNKSFVFVGCVFY